MTSVPLASPLDAVSFSPDVPRPMAVAAPTCLRVLVAEDQPLLRRLMVRTIERLGHEAIAAEDGAQAWELFVERPADVVITDWLMPELDGLALCRRLRAEGAESYPYVILASVLDDPRDVQSGLSAGADEYLIKPIATAALEARLIAVERLLRDHGREHTVAGGERLLQFTSGPTEAESKQPLPKALAAVIRQLESDVEALYRWDNRDQAVGIAAATDANPFGVLFLDLQHGDRAIHHPSCASIWTDIDWRDAHDLSRHGR